MSVSKQQSLPPQLFFVFDNFHTEYFYSRRRPQHAALQLKKNETVLMSNAKTTSVETKNVEEKMKLLLNYQHINKASRDFHFLKTITLKKTHIKHQQIYHLNYDLVTFSSLQSQWYPFHLNDVVPLKIQRAVTTKQHSSEKQLFCVGGF